MIGSSFLLGFLIAALIGGTVAYNCYSKREIIERKLRQNIRNLEHNLAILKKESQLRVEQLDAEVQKYKEQNRKAYQDIDMQSKDINSLKRQLLDCHKKLQEAEE